MSRSSTTPVRGRTRPSRCAGPSWVLALLLAVLSPSCFDDNLPVFPGAQTPQGRVQGRVRIAGEGARVRISLVPSRVRNGAKVDLETAEDGRFLVPVPDGDYRLSLESIESDLHVEYWYSKQGPVLNSDRSDVLRVRSDSAAVTLNLDFGAIDFRLALPAELPAGRIELRVRPPSSTPYSSYFHTSYLTVEDGAIRARLAPLAAGAYTIALDGLPSGVDLWLPGTLHAAEADTIVVTTGAAVPYERAFAARAGRFRGSVVGAWQRLGLHGPGVFAVDDDSIKIGAASAGAAGDFKLWAFAADRVRIGLSFGETTRWVGGSDFSSATVFPITEGEEIVLPPIEDGGLLLRLTGAGGEKTRNIDYHLFDGTGRTVTRGNQRVSGDHSGIAGLAPGEYSLRLKPHLFGEESWVAQWYDRAAIRDQATVIRVPEGGQVVPLTITLEPGGTIRGRLTWQDVIVAPGFALVPAERDTCGESGNLRTSPERNFEIRGVPDGMYKLAVGSGFFYPRPCGSPLPQGWIWYGQTASWDSAAVITIRDHQAVEGIDILLP